MSADVAGGGLGVGSQSASASGYGKGSANDAARNGPGNVTTGKGGKGKAVEFGVGIGNSGSVGEGTAASKGKKRVAGPEVMPKNVPDELSKRNPPAFQDTMGRAGAISPYGATLGKVTELDRDPDVQPRKLQVVQRGYPRIQTTGRLSHTRIERAQKMCTFGSHRRSENWTHGFHQQTKGPFSDHLPFKTRNTLTPTGVGSNLGI